MYLAQQRRVAPSTYNQVRCALKFFYQVTLDEGDSMEKSADIRQYIWFLDFHWRGETEFNFFGDATHFGHVSDEVAVSALALWNKPSETFWSEAKMRPDHSGDNYAKLSNDPFVTVKQKSVEWLDPVGYAPSPAGPGLSASIYTYATFRIAIRVVAKGSDGKEVTAQFWTQFSAQSSGGNDPKWEIKKDYGSHPALAPYTWTPQP